MQTTTKIKSEYIKLYNQQQQQQKISAGQIKYISKYNEKKKQQKNLNKYTKNVGYFHLRLCKF